MVDAGVGEAAIISAIVAAGSTAVAANQQHEAANRAGRSADALAAKSLAEANKPPDDPGMVASAQQMQANEQRAASAGGTITGKSNSQIGDAANAPRKSLLGT
jgi:hypothetical protein